MKISVLIATRNRPVLLSDCLNSITSNRFSSYEILVIDQSANNQTLRLLKKFKAQVPVRYIKINPLGKGKALNIGVHESEGEIITFTDDDCLVDSDWLRNIAREFEGQKKEIVVTGRVIPTPKKNHGELAPSTKSSFKRRVFTKPKILSDLFSEILYGNNMAFHRSVFQKIGFFDEDFGPGTLFKSCEDDDMGYRLLRNHVPIVYSPDVLVYHRSWRSAKQDRENRYNYGYGKAGFYLRYFLEGNLQMLIRLIVWIVLRIGLGIWAGLRFQRNELLKQVTYLRGMISGGRRMWRYYHQREGAKLSANPRRKF